MKNTMDFKCCKIKLIGIVLLILNGCTTVPVANPNDPWESWNRSAMTFNDNLDEYIMEPLAEGYQWITPSFVDRAVTNFFNNLGEIKVIVNDILQLKPLDAGRNSGRFVINSTLGLGGLVDVAEKFNLDKQEEDFDQTLAVWGVPSGPYLVIPFYGPSSPRGILGILGDVPLNPQSYTFLLTGYTFSEISLGLFTLDAIDRRAELLDAESIASEAAIDRYEYFKAAYWQRREYLINDGEVPLDDYELEMDEYFNDEDNSVEE